MAAYILTSKNLNPLYTPAYASVRLTLTGAGIGEKYVLQVWSYDEATATYGNQLADLRQNPNNNGDAIFDIQNILQAYVGVDPDLERQPRYETSEGSTYTFALKVGREVAGEFVEDVTYEPYELVPTRLDYYQDILNTLSNVTPTVSGDDESAYNCTIIDEVGDLLTDLPTYQAGEFLGGRPSYIGEGDAVHRIKLTTSDWHTVSFRNSTFPGGTLPEAETDRIKSWIIYEYAGDTLVDTHEISNVTTNGGGPSAIDPVEHPYRYETFQTSTNNTAWTLDMTTTHYWMYPVVYTPYLCNPLTYNPNPAMTPIRVDLYDNNCLDYDHIQVSWMNSYGFRDYYTFTKKNEKRVDVQRNSYFKEPINYNGTDLTLYTYDRGETVYSQKVSEIWTATTDYMDDQTAGYLQNLFQSPDTRVRFGDSTDWYPVILTSNSYTERTYRKDKLFQYEIQFRLAHPLKTQRG